MTAPAGPLVWDQVGQRYYETGVDKGVLYLRDNAGVYGVGYAWNGLITVTESPGGADANPLYADNIKYLNLIATETLDGTIEAYTYPEEFGVCDGTTVPQPGVHIGQQSRRTFGMSYRTRKGNDALGIDYGYKLHLLYGALAAPSEKAYGTINDTPDALTFSWGFSTTAVPVTGAKPTSLITIDSTKVQAGALATLEAALYGDADTGASLPLPDEVVTMFAPTGP
jgi:hypothetical protein